MDAAQSFRGPHMLIVGGLIPLILWFFGLVALMLLWRFEGPGYEIYLVAPTGIVAYLISLALAGGGCLWADRRAKSAHIGRPTLTRRLIQLVAVVLIAPWLLVPLVLMIWGGQ
jgi:hypothetical protein